MRPDHTTTSQFARFAIRVHAQTSDRPARCGGGQSYGGCHQFVQGDIARNHRPILRVCARDPQAAQHPPIALPAPKGAAGGRPDLQTLHGGWQGCSRGGFSSDEACGGCINKVDQCVATCTRGKVQRHAVAKDRTGHIKDILN